MFSKFATITIFGKEIDEEEQGGRLATFVISTTTGIDFIRADLTTTAPDALRTTGRSRISAAHTSMAGSFGRELQRRTGDGAQLAASRSDTGFIWRASHEKAAVATLQRAAQDHATGSRDRAAQRTSIMMRDLEALWAMAKIAAAIYFAFAIGKIVFDVFIKAPHDERRARAVQEADDLRRRESIGKRLGMPPKVSRLIFKAADLLDIVDHSLGAPTQMESCIIDYRGGMPIHALPEAAAVLLIHDRGGVYLMSNGDPDYTNEGWPDGANAAGCDPHGDNRCYETIRALIGNDHFTECLPWAAKIKQRIDAGAKEIIIEISRTSLELLPDWASADDIARSILCARSTV